ncbi:MAG: IS66 family transposase [Pirellulales bacterium]
MPRRRTELPRTLKGCHKLILELYETIDELRARIAQLERELYGPRRERFISDGRVKSTLAVPDLQNEDQPVVDSVTSQAPLAEFEESAALAIDSDKHDGIEESSDRPKRTSKGRRPRTYPASAPRVKVFHPLNETVVPPEVMHDSRARRFYRFVREEVELPQRHLRIIEHYQEVIAVDDPGQVSTVMYTAPVPAPFLDRCYAGNSLLAYLAVSRFSDHLPYYREEDILRREGLSIHRSTQWRWMRGLARAVSPLVDLIRQRLRTSPVLGIDETPCPIIDPSLPHTRSAYLYAQFGDDSQPYAGFYFADHKTRANIESMLQGFSGVLQSDAYICYELIAEASSDQIQPASCWAHGRRKFEPLVVPGKKSKASWILKAVQKLYDIEDRGRDLMPVGRLALRQAESKPIVEEIHRWLQHIQATERPRAAIRKAANYFLKRWDSFTRFLTNGSIRIDNNATEAVIKGAVMGRKAWLFLGNHTAGETAASLYTLIMSCKRHCIDPQSYLLDVLNRVKTATADELEDLLPDRWILSHPEAYVEQRAQESAAAADRKRTRRQARRPRLAAS